MEKDDQLHLAKERNRLAVERTFLAWIRTGLGLVGAGFAIMRLLTLGDIEQKQLIIHVGQILVFLGVAIFAFSYVNYRYNIKELKLVCGGSVWAITALVFILAVTTILLFIILMS